MRGETEFLILDPFVPSFKSLQHSRLFVIAGASKQPQKAETVLVFTLFLTSDSSTWLII